MHKSTIATVLAACVIAGAGCAPAPLSATPPTPTSTTSAARGSTTAAPNTPATSTVTPTTAGPAQPSTTAPSSPTEATTIIPTDEVTATNGARVAIIRADLLGSTITVAATITGVVEDGGTCTLTATAPGSPTLTHQTTAFADAQSTVCDPMSVVAPAGLWTVTVTYDSPATHAVSASQKVVVS